MDALTALSNSALSVENAEGEMKLLRDVVKTYRPEDRNKYLFLKAVMEGKLVFDLSDVVSVAGYTGNGLPKIAIAPINRQGRNITAGWIGDKLQYGTGMVGWSWGTLTRGVGSPFATVVPEKKPSHKYSQRNRETVAQARVPSVPLHLRPEIDEGHFVLFEPTWEEVPVPRPADPYLCRRIGKTNLFIVEGAWDLTPLEASLLETEATK